MNKWRDDGHRLPLVLLGARQVGKSYLVEEFGKGFPGGVVVFNFEAEASLHKLFEGDLLPGQIIRELEFHQNIKISGERRLLFFDEIQACPRALTSLKYFAEQAEGQAVCAAGSLLGLNLSAESFPVGKVELLHLHPLSFAEFLAGIEDERGANALAELSGDRPTVSDAVHAHLWNQFKDYLVVGGLPAVVNTYRQNLDNKLTALQMVRQKQLNLVTMYQADMAKHAGKTNAMHIERVFRNVPEQLGRVVDDSVRKFAFSGIIPGSSNYRSLAGPIDWLEKAGLITRIKICEKAELPLAAYTKDNAFKLYLFDTGLLGAISGLSPQTIHAYDYGTYKGFIAENFVVQEIVAADMMPIFGWREGSAEIEFLHDVAGEIVPIEAKSGIRTQAKSLGVFRQKYRPKLSVITSGKRLEPVSDQSVRRLPLYLAGNLPAVVERLIT